MNILTSLLEGAATAVTGTGDVLVAAAGKVGEIFYTPGVSGAAGELTVVGAGLCFGIGAGAIYLLFRMIRGLIKSEARG